MHFSENPKHSTKICLLVFFTFPINEIEIWEINFKNILVPFLFCNCSFTSECKSIFSENSGRFSVTAATVPSKIKDEISG